MVSEVRVLDGMSSGRLSGMGVSICAVRPLTSNRRPAVEASIGRPEVQATPPSEMRQKEFSFFALRMSAAKGILFLCAPYVCQCPASTLAYGANQSSGIGVSRARRAYQIPWQGLHLW